MILSILKLGDEMSDIESENKNIDIIGGASEKENASELKWYCIRTFTGHETRVKQAIEAEIKRLSLQDRIGEIVVPLETVYEVRNGKRRSRVRNFLPGYVVVNAALDKKIIDIITSITGVMNFVGRKNSPTPLQLSEVERIFGRVEERAGIETIAQTYNEGDPVKVIDGPFSTFSGIIKEVNNEKQKLKVEVGILGRKTPIELDFVQVELERPS